MSADIHSLEIAFAKNPILETCLPLCDAYLREKRYMEAMVVCKKGIKNAPTEVRGRVMLVRVYVEQGKLPKAEQELAQILQDFPAAPAALELLATVKAMQNGTPVAASVAATPVAAAPAVPAVPAASPASVPKPPPLTVAAAVPVSTPPAISASPAVQAPIPVPMGHEVSSPKLERVQDFFAPDTLGFSADAPEIETAGPGRLTIVGFVPKNVGSLKNTLLVGLAVFIVAALVITWQVTRSQNQRQMSDLFRKVRAALDDDRYVRYKEALMLSQSILKIDDKSVLTWSAIAYANAVLALEHGELEALSKSQAALSHLQSVSKQEENEYHIAAEALVAYQNNQLEQGLANIQSIVAKGASHPLVELELFRLLAALKPDSKETQDQLRILLQKVVSEPRIYNFLGTYYYDRDDWQRGEKYYDQALQNSRGNHMAMLGRSAVWIEQNIGMQQRQQDVERDLQEVLSAPESDRSVRLTALAYLVRGRLRLWQDRLAEAQQDFSHVPLNDASLAPWIARRGVAYLNKGDSNAALADLRRAVELDPRNSRYLMRLAEVLFKQQLFAEAQSILDKIRTMATASTETQLLSGDLAVEQKDYAAALAAYKAISAADDPDDFHKAQLKIGHTLILSGSANDAVQFLENYVEKMPTNLGAENKARAWCELGQAYESAKNKAKALQSYDVGLEQYRYFADCYFYQCRLLGRGPLAKQACKTYLSLDPHGRYAAQAQRF